jgi:hypothetical protein
MMVELDELIKEVDDMEWKLYRVVTDKPQLHGKLAERIEAERALFKKVLDYLKQLMSDYKIDVSKMTDDEIKIIMMARQILDKYESKFTTKEDTLLYHIIKNTKSF